MSNDLITPYREAIDGILERIRERELPAIRKAGRLLADAIEQDGFIGKQRGLHVIGLTSRGQAEAATSRQTSGLCARGAEPRVLVSQNLPGTDARNQELFARYRGRLRHAGA